MDELRGLGAVREELKARGGEIWAVSVDPVERLVEGRKDHPDLPCVLASDAGLAALETLHVVHQVTGKKLAVPCNLLVDRAGVVRWTHYAGLVSDRPDPQIVLDEVRKLPAVGE